MPVCKRVKRVSGSVSILWFAVGLRSRHCGCCCHEGRAVAERMGLPVRTARPSCTWVFGRREASCLVGENPSLAPCASLRGQLRGVDAASPLTASMPLAAPSWLSGPHPAFRVNLYLPHGAFTSDWPRHLDRVVGLVMHDRVTASFAPGGSPRLRTSISPSRPPRLAREVG